MLNENYMNKEIRTSKGGSNIRITVSNNYVVGGKPDGKHYVSIEFTNHDYNYAMPNKEEMQQLIDALIEAKNRMD